jgi:GNAT superfamily N-acetyltransferase
LCHSIGATLNKFIITRASLEDLAEIHEIEEVAYPAHLAESPEVLGSRIEVAPEFCAVARSCGICIAYLLAHPWPIESSPGLAQVLGRLPTDANAIHLHDLAVLPKMRGDGVAKSMLAWLEQRVSDDGYRTITLVAVNGADAFWRVMGFEDVGPADGYDFGARMMQRHLET